MAGSIGALSTGSLANTFQLNQIKKNNKNEAKSLGELAKGKKDVTSNITDLIKTENLEKTIRGIDAANRSTDSGASTLRVAEGGLQQTLSNLQDLRQLAVQAADSSISSQDRSNLTSQAAGYTDAINTTAQSTEFSGTNLLDGTFQNKSFQVGPNNGDKVEVSIDAANAEALGVSDIDLSTAEGANSAIDSLDAAIAQVGTQIVETSSKAKQLENAIVANDARKEDIAAAKSKISDLDLAQAIGQIEKQNIIKTSSIQVLQRTQKEQGKIFSAIL